MMAMAVLHGQTRNDMFAKQAVDTARASVIPNLYFYAVGENVLLNESIPADLRQRDLLYITAFSERDGSNTTGHFNNEIAQQQFAVVEIITTLFIIVVWLVGILAFVGPVMILVSTKRVLNASFLRVVVSNKISSPPLWNRSLSPSNGWSDYSEC